jgi:hypothetical protein
MNFMCVSYDCLYKGTTIFYERNDLDKKCLLPQLNVISIKGVGGTLVISLNY